MTVGCENVGSSLTFAGHLGCSLGTCSHHFERQFIQQIFAEFHISMLFSLCPARTRVQASVFHTVTILISFTHSALLTSKLENPS